MRKIPLGKLVAHVTGGSDGDGGGGGPVVVLLHGFGAPGTDLVPLAQAIPVDRAVRFVFPMAPLALETGPEDYVARAWWMIDMLALTTAVSTRRYDELASHEPAGLAEARGALETLLDAVEKELSPGAPVFLGGFSQGAMLATDTVLRGTRKLDGLIVLSGSLICQADWSSLASARSGLRVFQSHGRSDPILPYSIAEQLRDMLSARGVAVQFHSFSGGHGIPSDVLSALGAFIGAGTGPEA